MSSREDHDYSHLPLHMTVPQLLHRFEMPLLQDVTFDGLIENMNRCNSFDFDAEYQDRFRVHHMWDKKYDHLLR